MAKALLRRRRHCGGFGIFGLEASDIIFYALVISFSGFMAWAAAAKGGNPWVWGVAGFILGSLIGAAFAIVEVLVFPY